MKYIPIFSCYNPPVEFINIIKELIKNKFKNIIVIDGGSDKFKVFPKIKKIKECILLVNNGNFGKGASLKVGINYYKNHFINKYLGFTMMDCDLQHLVTDMINVGNKMLETDNFTIGVRNFNLKNVPFKNKMGNKITSWTFKKIYKVYIKDTQTGLRGIPNRLVDIVLSSYGDRYEYEINMLIDIVLKKEKIEEVEIATIYLEDKEKHSYFNSLKDSFLIYKELFNKKIK